MSLELERKLYQPPTGAQQVVDIGEGVLRGIASPYEVVDLGNDRVMPGAFTASLRESDTVPVLVGHDQKDIIGLAKLYDTPSALCAEIKLELGLQSARDTQIRLRAGLVKGLSIGYRTVRSRKVGSIRELLEVKLFEVSVVGFPMAPSAQVTSVKAGALGYSEPNAATDLTALSSLFETIIEDFDFTIEDLAGLTDRMRNLGGDAVASGLQQMLGTIREMRLRVDPKVGSGFRRTDSPSYGSVYPYEAAKSLLDGLRSIKEGLDPSSEAYKHITIFDQKIFDRLSKIGK